MGTPNTTYSTNTFSVDNSQRYQVIARTPCNRILVQENYNSANPPTADLLMAQPAGGTQVNISKGTAAIYTRWDNHRKFMPGDVAGDIQTVSGSITVLQIESQVI